MNLRPDVMADRPVHHDAVLDDGDADVDSTILDDERLADELAGTVELVAAFLGWAEPGLASGFETFTYGRFTLEEMRADLWRLGAWIRGNA